MLRWRMAHPVRRRLSNICMQFGRSCSSVPYSVIKCWHWPAGRSKELARSCMQIQETLDARLQISSVNQNIQSPFDGVSCVVVTKSGMRSMGRCLVGEAGAKPSPALPSHRNLHQPSPANIATTSHKHRKEGGKGMDKYSHGGLHLFPSSFKYLFTQKRNYTLTASNALTHSTTVRNLEHSL